MVNVKPFVSNRHAAKEPVIEPVVEPVVVTPTPSLTDLNTAAEPKPPAAPKKRKPANKSVAIE
jgi:hypothetical protein